MKWSDKVLSASVWVHLHRNRLAMTGALMAMGVGVADAATVGDMFTHIGDQAKNVADGLVKIFYASGFAAGGNGIWKLITRKSRNEGVGEGLTWLGGGAAVGAVGAMMDVALNSMLTDTGGAGFTNITPP